MESKHTHKSDAAHEAKKPSIETRSSIDDSAFVTEFTEGMMTPQHLLTMQRLVGNAALQRMIQRDVGGTVAGAVTGGAISAAAPASADRSYPAWATDEAILRRIQRELRRLGLYHLRIDGDYGPGTDAALVEAFGNLDRVTGRDEFRELDAPTVLDRLQNATPPTGDRRGEHDLRYGEMFRDGLLDLTLAVGNDEHGNNVDAEQGFRDVLGARGFVQDDNRARELYQQAGRTFSDNDTTTYFIKERAINYTPPAGQPRPIHAVVRLIFNRSGSDGAEAAGAFREGMIESDATFYGGHGRYGSGPDFDRNFGQFVLHPLPGTTDAPRTILNYEDLEVALRAEGRASRPQRSAWEQFRWRHDESLIDVDFSNAGNIRMNTLRMLNAQRRAKFGARLMQWALDQGHIALDTHEDGELGDRAEAHPERHYRVLVFNGCNTRDYETSIRATPGLGRDTTQTIESTQSLMWTDIPRTLASFLDSIIAQQSGEEIIRGMDDEQYGVARSDGSFVSSGTRYNPVQR